MSLVSDFYAVEMGDGTPELDLHGESVNVAMGQLESFIQMLFMQKEPYGKVIHGRGTGVLRDAVHDHLRKHKLVSAFDDAQSMEHMGGMTIVKLNI